MQNQPSSLLRPNITLDASNFAVQWETEKTGLPNLISDYASFSDEDHTETSRRRKRQFREAYEEPQNMDEEVTPDREHGFDEIPEVLLHEDAPQIYYYYKTGGTAGITTTPSPSFLEISSETYLEEQEYRFHGRNYTKRIASCRRNRH